MVKRGGLISKMREQKNKNISLNVLYIALLALINGFVFAEFNNPLIEDEFNGGVFFKPSAPPPPHFLKTPKPSEFLKSRYLSSLGEPIFLAVRGGKAKKTNLRRRAMTVYIQLNRALDFMERKNYLEAVKRLFILKNNPRLKKQKTQINFVLGQAFYKLGLFHAAGFHFIAVVRTGSKKYIRKSLQMLSQIASIVGDDDMLSFAVKKGGARKVQGEYRNSLYYKYGKYNLKKKDYMRALKFLKKVSSKSPLYGKAQYNMGLAYAEKGRTKPALAAFRRITSKYTRVTDPLRVAALMGQARVYYQEKKWQSAVHYYRQVPKDSFFWHDMLFENSWALLRGGRFRSALNSFQTLHSSYYEDYFQPGSLLLRAIIYMYICKYDEMEKVLSLFQRTYAPIQRGLIRLLERADKNPLKYYALVSSGKSSALARSIVHRIQRETDFQSVKMYLEQLEAEEKLINSLPMSWRVSKTGRYSLKLVKERLKESRIQAGKIVQRHLRSASAELKQFFNQEEYLKYEMLRGKRSLLSKKISRRGLKDVQIISDKGRDFFVQNGFEFWPFKGEYWLDELGNYHYVGSQNCR